MKNTVNANAHTQETAADISFNCYRAVKEAKSNAIDNLQIVNSLSNSMNRLSSSLDRLDNLMESIIFNQPG
jgi:methyl-accepting chemotaxis protein